MFCKIKDSKSNELRALQIILVVFSEFRHYSELYFFFFLASNTIFFFFHFVFSLISFHVTASSSVISLPFLVPNHGVFFSKDNIFVAWLFLDRVKRKKKYSLWRLYLTLYFQGVATATTARIRPLILRPPPLSVFMIKERLKNSYWCFWILKEVVAVNALR